MIREYTLGDGAALAGGGGGDTGALVPDLLSDEVEAAPAGDEAGSVRQREAAGVGR